MPFRVDVCCCSLLFACSISQTSVWLLEWRSRRTLRVQTNRGRSGVAHVQQAYVRGSSRGTRNAHRAGFCTQRLFGGDSGGNCVIRHCWEGHPRREGCNGKTGPWGPQQGRGTFAQGEPPERNTQHLYSSAAAVVTLRVCPLSSRAAYGIMVLGGAPPQQQQQVEKAAGVAACAAFSSRSRPSSCRPPSCRPASRRRRPSCARGQCWSRPSPCPT